MIQHLFPRWCLLAACCLALIHRPLSAAGPADQALKPLEASSIPMGSKPVTRLVYEDHQDATVRWSDVFTTADGRLGFTRPMVVARFPHLDHKRQRLVQMRESGGVVVVGVRDDSKGTYGSGHVVIDTGVGKHDHGDHHHWSYLRDPEVVGVDIGKSNGNPAHVYEYDGKVYVANDQINGYTLVDPESCRSVDGKIVGKISSRFIKGGGNHITLAVHGAKVGYSAWIDGGGPNKGRVDVSSVSPDADGKIAYSFNLPHGGIHGAATSSGKVFFAPANGICWIVADNRLSMRPGKEDIHHLSLGEDGDKPARTGAFSTLGNHLLCVAGKGHLARLAIIRASGEQPSVVRSIPLGVKERYQAVTPVAYRQPVSGKPFAFVFHDKAGGDEAGSQGQADSLQIIELDPDGNGSFDDAAIAWRNDVGPSRVDGHFGHHSIAMDGNGGRAFITNSGNGTIQVFPATGMLGNKSDFTTLASGGCPSHIICVGGSDVDD